MAHTPPVTVLGTASRPVVPPITTKETVYAFKKRGGPSAFAKTDYTGRTSPNSASSATQNPIYADPNVTRGEASVPLGSPRSVAQGSSSSRVIDGLIQDQELSVPQYDPSTDPYYNPLHRSSSGHYNEEVLQSPEEGFVDADEDEYMHSDSLEGILKNTTPEGYGSSQASIMLPPPTPDSAINPSSLPPSVPSNSPTQEKGKGKVLRTAPKRQRTSQSQDMSYSDDSELQRTRKPARKGGPRSPAKKAARNRTEQKSRQNRSNIGRLHLGFATEFQARSPGFIPDSEFKGAADGEKFTLRLLYKLSSYKKTVDQLRDQLKHPATQAMAAGELRTHMLDTIRAQDEIAERLGNMALNDANSVHAIEGTIPPES
ncbi:hypothetical protein SISSUDRAFT_1067284 [Sistotremastrum suecicum HHB10207 ss-3]|uniref:Uncharacterized protein n=1 Tax=Sistotremastrum suecicum HHB10207 ss-3 TaxID=1314776 RepID=A0A165XAI5_9AGAM|nr:hypothetical protein SISSUDRAFT_1067284 [Sistotremastrum suecicum HHB10207 ss-3]